jgi:transcriptional regulator with XRE-family HTH domain
MIAELERLHEAWLDSGLSEDRESYAEAFRALHGSWPPGCEPLVDEEEREALRGHVGNPRDLSTLTAHAPGCSFLVRAGHRDCPRCAELAGRTEPVAPAISISRTTPQRDAKEQRKSARVKPAPGPLAGPVGKPSMSRPKKYAEQGARLRAARIAAGYQTAKALANEMGVPSGRISDAECGFIVVPQAIIDRVCQAVGVTLDQIGRVGGPRRVVRREKTARAPRQIVKRLAKKADEINGGRFALEALTAEDEALERLSEARAALRSAQATYQERRAALKLLLDVK